MYYFYNNIKNIKIEKILIKMMPKTDLMTTKMTMPITKT